MNNRQRNKLNMYELVKDFLLASVTITSKIAVFAALYSIFADYVAEIYAVSEKQEEDRTGLTKAKGEKKASLVKKLLSIAKRCVGYASGVNDPDMRQVLNVEISKLNAMADADLIKKAESLITFITPLLPQLTGYNVNDTDLKELLELKNDFKLIYPQVEGGRGDTARLTARLDLLYDKTDAVLKQIDDQVGSLFDTEPEFFETYTHRRAIVQLAKRQRALQIWVVADATGLPVVKAKVTITSKSKGNTEFTKSVKRTGAQGGVAANNMAEGEYYYEVQFGGRVMLSGSFFINAGITTTLTLRMKLND